MRLILASHAPDQGPSVAGPIALTVTGGSGNGYTDVFLDTGLLQPGTLTLPLEKGDFCD